MKLLWEISAINYHEILRKRLVNRDAMLILERVSSKDKTMYMIMPFPIPKLLLPTISVHGYTNGRLYRSATLPNFRPQQ